MTEAWIAFETEVGRGRGHLRLKEGKAWTLLTTLDELKGHEEPRGDRRPQGVVHGGEPDRETWLEERAREAEELGHVTRSRRCVIVGGGQGGIALGARLRQLGVPTVIVERNERARATRGASATSRSACTTRSGTTTCPTSSSPTTGRSSRPRTRSPTGSRCTRG